MTVSLAKPVDLNKRVRQFPAPTVRVSIVRKSDRPVALNFTSVVTWHELSPAMIRDPRDMPALKLPPLTLRQRIGMAARMLNNPATVMAALTTAGWAAIITAPAATVFVAAGSLALASIVHGVSDARTHFTGER